MVLACDWASLKWGSKSTGNLRKSQIHSRQTSNIMPLKTGQSLHPLADWCLPIGQVQRRNSSLQSLSHMTQMHILMSKATSSHSSHAVYLPSVQVDMPNAGHNALSLVSSTSWASAQPKFHKATTLQISFPLFEDRWLYIPMCSFHIF